MEVIIDLLGKIIAAAFVSVIFLALKELKSFILAKKEEIEDEKLRALIESFVEAAEQMLKEDDPDGTIRKQYVEENLKLLGYEINEQINAYIEAYVFDINHI